MYVNMNYDVVIAGGKYENSLVGASDGSPGIMTHIDLLKYEGRGFEVLSDWLPLSDTNRFRGRAIL